jgi:hypothetical protein
LQVRAIARLPVFASKIASTELRKAVSSSKAIADLCQRSTEGLLTQARINAACNASHPIKARLCRSLLETRDIAESDTITLTQEFLAQMLGVRRTSVTEIASKIQAIGAISYSHGVIKIIDPEAVKAYELQKWYRFFPIPDIGHGTGALAGGPGPSPVDPFAALVNWAENHVAPASITALAAGVALDPGRTRPLCPYPQTAIYNGSGSTDVASNFHCGGNLETRRVVCNDARTLYKHENGPVLDFRSIGVNPGQCEQHEADRDHDHDHGHD